jgi:Spy/CpxP family protein refolding chaperone
VFNKSKLWAFTLLLAAFAAGVAVGGVASAVLAGRQGPRGPGGGRHPEVSFLEHLDRDLHLTPVQHDSVAAILKRYDEPMRQLWRAERRGFDSLRVQVRGDISRVLNDQQRVQFDRMNQRMDSLRAVREHGGASRDR